MEVSFPEKRKKKMGNSGASWGERKPISELRGMERGLTAQSPLAWEELAEQGVEHGQRRGNVREHPKMERTKKRAGKGGVGEQATEMKNGGTISGFLTHKNTTNLARYTKLN